MRISNYIKDKISEIFVLFFLLFVVTFLLILFNTNIILIIGIPFFILLSFIICFMFDYFKRRIFYDNIIKSLNNLDKKYLITEIIDKPGFIEGDLLVDYLYEINKSYIEEINKYKYSSKNFKEYIELWCHEIKTPIATSKLVSINNKNKATNSILEELDRIDSYVEQVLFYARSENVSDDYIITSVNLKQIIDNVIKKNKKDILTKKIKIAINNLISNVNSDSKWLEFIINQIVVNSIKYSKDSDSFIEISSKENKNNIILTIKDNGIGIPTEELEKVFIKGFTGSNGRKKYNSTGIGLYLVKKLCDKLGHNIVINSKENVETVVTIVFPSSSLINDIR